MKFKDDIFTHTFERIIYCQPNNYSVKNQEFFKRLQIEFPKIELCQGLPNIALLQLDMNNLPKLILIDDLMSQVMASHDMIDLLSKDVHNFNISVCITLQNYYAVGRYGKTLMRNSQYRIIFYNQIEYQELTNISYQISGKKKFLSLCFQSLFREFPQDPSHYLLIDGHFRSQLKQFWCRTHIFPKDKGGEIEPIIFYPNPNSNYKE